MLRRSDIRCVAILIALQQQNPVPGQDPVAAEAPPVAATTTTTTTGPRTRLVYELPAYELSKLLASRPDLDAGAVVDATIAALAVRVPRATVQSLGGHRFALDIDGSRRDAERIRARVESRRVFSLHRIADDRADAHLDLDDERRRLHSWLDRGGLERVLRCPADVRTFHHDPIAGTRTATAIRWIPHRVHPRSDDPSRWSIPLSRQAPLGREPDLRRSVVAAFDDEDWNDGAVPAAQLRPGGPPPFLLEFVAIDPRAGALETDDFQFDIRVQHGVWALAWAARRDREPRCSAWADEQLRRRCAVVLDGDVVATPFVRSPNDATSGMLGGRLGPDELPGLVTALNHPPLPVIPTLVRAETLR